MRTPVYINGQYLDQNALNLMANDATSGIRQVANGWQLPGLVHPELIAWSTSGLTVTAIFSSPFAIQFGSGVISSALGTSAGSSGATYTIPLSGFVPGTGSQTVYINASYFALSQTQEAIVGPPQGNPAFNPGFVPFMAYLESVDSIGVSGGLSPASSPTSFELARVTLSAGQTGIALGSLSYANQTLSSSIDTLQTTQVSASTILTQSNAGLVYSAQASGINLTLPSVASSNGYPFYFAGGSGIGSGFASILSAGSDKIFGLGGPGAGYTTLSLTSGMFLGLTSNGTFWNVIGQSGAEPISWNASGTPPSPISISTSGGVQTPYGITASGATNPNQLTTYAQTLIQGGVAGDSRNLTMNVPATSSTATLTADEIVVKTALGQASYALPTFNKTLNLATTGPGGMDIGAPPDTGYVAIYAIYDPTTGSMALLATNATSTVAPSIYAGGHMPVGYTASALVSVWPTNASGQFIIGYQYARSISVPQVSVLAILANQTAITALNIATFAPPNAKSISGIWQAGSTTAGNVNLYLLTGPGNVGAQWVGGDMAANTLTAAPFSSVTLSMSQTTYYMTNAAAGTPTYDITLSGYTI